MDLILLMGSVNTNFLTEKIPFFCDLKSSLKNHYLKLVVLDIKNSILGFEKIFWETICLREFILIENIFLLGFEVTKMAVKFYWLNFRLRKIGDIHQINV